MLNESSMDTWFVTLISIGYLAILFVVAYQGEGQSRTRWISRPVIYSLSLAISCTSWAFYGMVGQSALTGEFLSPVYMGTTLCLLLLWPMLLKMLRITKRQNLTSIADFIACRYGRSPKIAILVTLVALVGSIPYIALQLRAVTISFELLTGTDHAGANTALVITVVLIGFSILFGTRQIATSKQNQGLVLAIAFGSIIKLVAFLAVGLFVTYYLFDGFIDVMSKQAEVIKPIVPSHFYATLSQVFLGALTVFVLPRQFHMMVIENHHEDELKSARWLFPLYLLLLNLFVLPIAIAGLVTFNDGSVAADTFVLTLPLHAQQTWLVLLAYVGGLAAATSMVIVAAIVLSTMVANEIVNPLVLRFKLSAVTESSAPNGLLLKIRRWAIAVVLLLAFIFERLINLQSHLAGIGLLSFVLLAQFAPLIVGALYWRKATTNAALTSLLAGTLVWTYTLLLPTLSADSALVVHGPFGIDWLKPTALLGLSGLDHISHGLFYSLLANLSCFIAISLLSRASAAELLQADVFLDRQLANSDSSLRLMDVQLLLKRFIDSASAAQILAPYLPFNDIQQTAPAALVAATRLQLSGVLGSASTRMVINAVSTSQQGRLDDVASIVDEASEVLRFNRELLHAAVENIEQGISVIDADMRVVAWNQRYIELMGYPEGLVKLGMSVEVLLRLNAARGLIVCDDVDAMVARRLAHMREGHGQHTQQITIGDKVLELRGQAMPGGGFVTSFSDISAHRNAEKALQVANDELEQRVLSRTEQLMQAKAEAEQANLSKTRFLAAASHDLMQPFNALGLFTSLLKQKVEGTELAPLAANIGDSLGAADELLSDLVEISKLDGGAQKVQYRQFALAELLIPLANEFKLITAKAEIDFRCRSGRGWLNTDKALLRRIVQNFLTNAVKYGQGGKILLGVRHRGNKLRIEVWDSGPGIAADKLKLIFTEFERLNHGSEKPGLGLGLAICERIGKLLDATIEVRSIVGRGSCFALELPRVVPSPPGSLAQAPGEPRLRSSIAAGDSGEPKVEKKAALILVIDNDPLVLTAMTALLSDWGYRVVTDLHGTTQPDLILSDYHLPHTNGVDLVQELLAQRQWQTPCIINSADASEAVRQHTISAGYRFIGKPTKPLALKRLILKATLQT